MLPEFPVAAAAVARLRGKELKFAIGIKGGAIPLLQFGLVIERVNLTHSTRAKNLDDTLCLRWMMSIGESLVSQHR